MPYCVFDKKKCIGRTPSNMKLCNVVLKIYHHRNKKSRSWDLLAGNCRLKGFCGASGMKSGGKEDNWARTVQNKLTTAEI